MNEQIAAVAMKPWEEQGITKEEFIAMQVSKDEQVDSLLEALKSHVGENILGDEIILLKDYIDLKRRQAQKASNQRKTLRDLHKVYGTALMENRWLRSELRSQAGAGGKTLLEAIMVRAKDTLFRQFKKEEK